MTLNEIKTRLKSDVYNFLREDEHLGKNIVLLGLGGSHAYGLSTQNSDLDVRGICANKKDEILTGNFYSQFVETDTDTTIYSFNKMIQLLARVNPNTIEILGLKPEHYLYVTDIGQEILDNKEMFLSKLAVNSFGGYANQQIYRLNQKCKHKMAHDELEKHILKTLEFMQYNFVSQFSPMHEDDFMKLYIDKSNQENYDTEIYMDVQLTHYPLRDYCSMWNTLQMTVKQYGQLGKRNMHAIEHDKIAKHMVSLVRLYMMALDILNDGKIITYREKEHDLLMDIRNGKYLDENDNPTKEFFDMIDDYEAKLDVAKTTTQLPDEPDYEKINKFIASVNERIVLGEL